MESSRTQPPRHRLPVSLVAAALSLAVTFPAAASSDYASVACRSTPGGPILLSVGNTIVQTELFFGLGPSDRPAPTRKPAVRPTATAVVRPTAPRAPTATRIPQASLPDLVPMFEGAPFRHLVTDVRREVNGQAFCNAIVPQAVENTPADITPGDLRWGVRNAGRSDIAGKFRIRLTTGAHVEDRTIVGLRAGETKLFDVRRPASRTNVTRLGLEPDAATRQRYGALSGGRCVQTDPQQNPSLEWQDPSFEVEVDTTHAVNEGPTGGETNNTRTF